MVCIQVAVLRLGHTDIYVLHSFYIRCHVLLALDFASSVCLLLIVRHEGPGSLQLSVTFSGLRRGRKEGREGGRGGGGGGREGKREGGRGGEGGREGPTHLLVTTPTYHRPHPPPCSHTHLQQVPPTSLFILTMEIHLLTLSETSW